MKKSTEELILSEIIKINTEIIKIHSELGYIKTDIKNIFGEINEMKNTLNKHEVRLDRIEYRQIEDHKIIVGNREVLILLGDKLFRNYENRIVRLEQKVCA